MYRPANYHFDLLSKGNTVPTRKTSPLELGFYFGLYIPVILLLVMLKIVRIYKFGEIDSFTDFLGIFRNDIFLAALLFAAGKISFNILRRHSYRSLILTCWQIIIFITSFMEIIAHNYFLKTGSLFSWDLLLLTFRHFREFSHVAASESDIQALFLLYGFCLLVVILPWLISAFVYLNRKRYFLNLLDELPVWRGFVSAFLPIGLIFFIITPGHSDEQAVFSRNFTYEMAWSWLHGGYIDEEQPHSDSFEPVQNSYFEKRKFMRRRNLVVIVLESTRADATSIYKNEPDTTPFLRQIARKSLLVERGYSVNPHTSKSLVAIHCGIEPKPGMNIIDPAYKELPARCMPSLLEDRGYSTVFFQTPTKYFEDRDKLVPEMKFQEFYSSESYNKTGFSEVNYFGYEDKILLGPVTSWLKHHKKINKKNPFMMTILTNTTHHYYGIPASHKMKKLSNDPHFNRYLNTVNYVDGFLKELFDVFDQMNLTDKTLFVITGDHGEAFMEHSFRGHSNNLYEETLRVPILFYAPGRIIQQAKINGPVAEIDILPTAAHLLGYKIRNNGYRGYNLVRGLPENREIFLSCWNDYTCLGLIKGSKKYIYWFDNKPEEIYNTADDRSEIHNLGKLSSERSLYRYQVLDWFHKIRNMYRNPAAI